MLPLALAAAALACDAEARLAGELMAMHQAGAAHATLVAAAGPSEGARAQALLPRITSAEVATDPEARELAAYHFAAETHARCTAGD